MSLARIGILTSLVFLGACSRTGPALLIELDASAVPGVEQFHILGREQDALVFGPTVRPEVADGPLEGKQTLRVILRDDLVGKVLTVHADALIGGHAVGFADLEAIPVDNREVLVSLVLQLAPAACAKCNGCCDRQQCISSSVAACGAGGVGCFKCDPIVADRCSPNGRCACGNGPACVQLQIADRCVDGQCVCGTTGSACANDQVCLGGVCRCTAESCSSGCCQDDRCMPGSDKLACGEGGNICTPCNANQNCNNKRCTPI